MSRSKSKTLTTGMTVHGSEGGAVILDSLLGAGGEGEVWSVRGDAISCAKMLSSAIRAGKRSRIAAMVESQPRRKRGHLQFAWPTEMLWSDEHQTQFVGFLMPRLPEGTIPGIELATTNIGNPVLSTARNQFAWKLNAAANLCEAFASLHAQGHRVGDVREVNLVFSTQGEVTFLDCDSFQIGEAFPCPMMGVEEYQPPECLVPAFSTASDRLHSDRWALAVLVWRIVHLGYLPFQHRGIESYTDAVMLGKAPLLDPRWAPVSGCPATERITVGSLTDLFRETFGVGRTDPAKRPDAHAYAQALRSVGGRGFHQCSRNPRHQWPRRSILSRKGQCPWCEAKGITGSLEVTKVETVRQHKVALKSEKARAVPSPTSQTAYSRGSSRWARWLGYGILAVFAYLLFDWADSIEDPAQATSVSIYGDFAPTLQVTGEGLHLREDATAKSRSLRALGPRESVQEIGRNGRWIQVRDSAGLAGWANGRFLSPLQIP